MKEEQKSFTRQNGQIYNIDFKGNRGSEVNRIHLGIIFTVPKSNNILFCISLTSPKEKHFKDIKAFKNVIIWN